MSRHGKATREAALSTRCGLSLLAKLVAPVIVELRRARRGMVRHRRRFFQRAAVLEISRDASRSETVVAEFGCDPGCRRAPADHRIRVRLRPHGARELAGAASDRAEQRSLGIAAQVSSGDLAFADLLIEDATNLPESGRDHRVLPLNLSLDRL
jgi:hypothetical protein